MRLLSFVSALSLMTSPLLAGGPDQEEEGNNTKAPMHLDFTKPYNDPNNNSQASYNKEFLSETQTDQIQEWRKDPNAFRQLVEAELGKNNPYYVLLRLVLRACIAPNKEDVISLDKNLEHDYSSTIPSSNRAMPKLWHAAGDSKMLQEACWEVRGLLSTDKTTFQLGKKNSSYPLFNEENLKQSPSYETNFRFILGYAELDSDQLNLLSSFITKNQQIRKLLIHNTNLPLDKFAPVIAKLSNLLKLELQNCNLDDESAPLILEIIKSCKRLRSLYFGGNKLTDSSINQIIKAAKDGKSIAYLHFGRNNSFSHGAHKHGNLTIFYSPGPSDQHLDSIDLFGE